MSDSGQQSIDDVANGDDPLQVYLREVGRVPALAAAEELHCFQHVRAADDKAAAARTRLVEANLHRVVALAVAHQAASVDLLDLIEACNRGLLRAAATLNLCTHDSFWPYAKEFVEKSLLEFQMQRHL